MSEDLLEELRAEAEENEVSRVTLNGLIALAISYRKIHNETLSDEDLAEIVKEALTRVDKKIEYSPGVNNKYVGDHYSRVKSLEQTFNEALRAIGYSSNRL